MKDLLIVVLVLVIAVVVTQPAVNNDGKIEITIAGTHTVVDASALASTPLPALTPVPALNRGWVAAPIATPEPPVVPVLLQPAPTATVPPLIALPTMPPPAPMLIRPAATATIPPLLVRP